MITTTNGPLGTNTQSRRNKIQLFPKGLGSSSFNTKNPATYLQNHNTIFDQTDLKYESPQQAQTRITNTQKQSTITRYQFANAQFSTILTQENPATPTTTPSVDVTA